jgi:hypothetical protein
MECKRTRQEIDVDERQFWRLIESGGPEAQQDRDLQLESVEAELRKLSPEEIVSFDGLFNQKLSDAHTWDLWGAAYQINGGCSDDGFYYFRSWLISRGREIFEASIQDPDSLAAIIDPDQDECDFEELWNAAVEIYEEMTGQEMPASTFQWSPVPGGERWNFDSQEETAHRLPTLTALYNSDEDE